MYSLQKENYECLLADMCDAAKELGNNDDDVVDLAENVRLKYLILFERFSSCYTLYSRAESFSQQEISTLGKLCFTVKLYATVNTNYSFILCLIQRYIMQFFSMRT